MISLNTSNKEAAFTLLEVLLSITILSIIAIPMFYYFIQAYQYTTESQNKTVAVNIARNVMNYMEKQNFLKLQNYLNPDTSKMAKLDGASCDDASTIFDNGNPDDLTICKSVLQPIINNKPYGKDEISIYLTGYYEDKNIRKSILKELQQNPTPISLNNIIEQKMDSKEPSFKEKLVQVFVVVDWHEKREKIVIEGVISDESLR